MVENYVARRQSSVPAQINLHRRCEPAQTKSRALCYKKCRLGQVIFRSDRLQYIVVQPTFQGTNSCWVTAEESLGKGIYLINWNLQGRIPSNGVNQLNCLEFVSMFDLIISVIFPVVIFKFFLSQLSHTT